MRRIPLAIWLFALPFVLLGLAAAVLAGAQIALHLQSLSWEAVPATLQAARQETHAYPGTPGALRQTTGRYAARYRYVVNGVEHEGERLSFSLAFDNGLDDWQEQVREHVGAPGDTFEIWVDPDNPAESVALRAVRWTEVGLLMLVALILAGSGLALLSAAARKGRAPAPGISWPLVCGAWAVAPFGLVVAWLLWMDSMPGWAVLGLLPVLLAGNGTIAGIRQRIRSRAGEVQEKNESRENTNDA